MAKKEDAIYQGEQNFASFPMTVSSPVIKQIDKRLEKATAFESMQKQTELQLSMLRKQAQLIMEQVKAIEERLTISYQIYEADINFVPLVGVNYYLYIDKKDKKLLSLISPQEWGNKMPYSTFISGVRLLADKTWELI